MSKTYVHYRDTDPDFVIYNKVRVWLFENHFTAEVYLKKEFIPLGNMGILHVATSYSAEFPRDKELLRKRIIESFFHTFVDVYGDYPKKDGNKLQNKEPEAA